MGYKHIPVKTDGYTIDDLIKKFNVGRTTAKKIRKRGYIVERTKNVKVMKNVKNDFDYNLAYNVAKSAFRKRIDPTIELAVRYRDDCIQSAVLGMIELSGIVDKDKSPVRFYFTVAVNSMNAFLKREGAKGLNAWKKNYLEDMPVEKLKIYAR